MGNHLISLLLDGVYYLLIESSCIEKHFTFLKFFVVPNLNRDNEYGNRSYEVPAFQAAKYKTTNGEFWEFVCDGGYGKADLWTDAGIHTLPNVLICGILPLATALRLTDLITFIIGWKWRSFRNAKWPSYWVGEGPQGLNQFSLRMLFDVVPMAWDLPVCVNLHEATAFASWKAKKNNKNYRVSSELEHHAIRDSSQQVSEDSVDMVLRGPAYGKMMTEVSTCTAHG